jgi:hypothetical protein
MRNEGHGSGEDPGRQPPRTLRRGESGMLRQQAMGQGEVSLGRWRTSNRDGRYKPECEIQRDAG